MLVMLNSLAREEWNESEIGAIQWRKQSLARTCGLNDEDASSQPFLGFLGFGGIQFARDKMGGTPKGEVLLSATRNWAKASALSGRADMVLTTLDIRRNEWVKLFRER